jgi:NAD(P)-dependent dehydrogenase (short-subunit alcohol dehydrogenase family)
MIVDMQDQVILISGAGSGIGAAGALELARRGALPVLMDIDEAGLRATAARLAGGVGGEPVHVLGDVSRAADCEAATAAALARHGRIDVVWANAGIASFGPLAHTDPAAFARCLEVNVLGVFRFVRAALPAVRQRRGYVAITASAASFAHAPMMSAYAASKAAVEALANAWRLELHAHGVGVGAIHAHWVQTPLVSEGALHPAFARLRQSMPSAMNRELPVEAAARLIADGIAARRRRIWVPGWVRWLFVLRSLLHTAPAERASLLAAPEMEALYLEGLAAEGVVASSYGPRERERVIRGRMRDGLSDATEA